MNTFTKKEYLEYLHLLIPSVWKMLPLYEKENEFLAEYIDSLLNFELYGSSMAIGEMNKKLWYHKTVCTLEGIELKLKENPEFNNPKIEENHKRFKREIFKITRMIAKQIKEIEG